MKTVHDIIKDMREKYDLTQTAVAKTLDTSQQQYSRYETGESDVPVHALTMLADYYKVSTDYLLGRKDDLYGVQGLSVAVTKEKTAGDVLRDILSLGAPGREAVVEAIALQKLKECCAKHKSEGGQCPYA